MPKKKIIYYADQRGLSPVLAEINRLPMALLQRLTAYISLMEEQLEQLEQLGNLKGEAIEAQLYEVHPEPNQTLYFFLLNGYAVILHFAVAGWSFSAEQERQTALNRKADFSKRYRSGDITPGVFA